MNSKQTVALILLLVGIVLQLITPVYNVINPSIGGLPFFYWFQTFLLLLVTLMYVGVTYLLREKEETESKGSVGGVTP